MKILINYHTLVKNFNLQFTKFHFDLKSPKIEVIEIRELILKALLKVFSELRSTL